MQRSINRWTKGLLFGAVLGCTAFATAAEEGGEAGFVDKPFDAALKQAAEEKKIVFVDFYATWCGPCKLLDSTTWKDENVQKWLKEKAVALKIDAEAKEELAEKYNVNQYPTLVFMKPDGTVLERVLGYVEADEFLYTANWVAKGKPTLVRIEEALANDPTDVMLRAERADALASLAKYEAAWKEYQALMDEGVENQGKLASVLANRVATGAVNLQYVLDPVQEDLSERSVAAEKKVVAGNATPMDVAVLSLVCASTGDAERLLAAYGKISESSKRGAAAQQMQGEIVGPLVGQERYEDLASSSDLSAAVERVFAEHHAIIERIEAGNWGLMSREPEMRDRTREIAKQSAFGQALPYYQTLLALGRTDEANKLAERMLKLQDGAGALNAIAWTGYLSGKPAEANVAQARKAYEMEDEKNMMVLDTLVRVLDARGKTEEAIELCRKALRKAETDFDKNLINECLEDFGAKE